MRYRSQFTRLHTAALVLPQPYLKRRRFLISVQPCLVLLPPPSSSHTGSPLSFSRSLFCGVHLPLCCCAALCGVCLAVLSSLLSTFFLLRPAVFLQNLINGLLWRSVVSDVLRDCIPRSQASVTTCDNWHFATNYWFLSSEHIGSGSL